MVATAAWCGRTLAERPYDLALNVGVCGSFDRELSPGSVVHTVSDRIAELGAEDGGRFLSIEELGLLDRDGRPYSGAEFVNASPPGNSALATLPRVSGITVNTVHGNDESIADVVRRFHPQVETMEGAAFMYACLMHGTPFAQVRAVSNAVERRNRDAWRLPEAIDGLGAVVIRMLEAS
jgi:futalosine hydrolase